MKRWQIGGIEKQRDKRHATALPARPRYRARHLAIERCEDRLVLSGTPLTLAMVSAPANLEGGYIAVSSRGLFQGDAHNFLLDAESLARSVGNEQAFSFEKFPGVGRNSPAVDIRGDSEDQTTSFVASLPSVVSHYDLNLSDLDLGRPLDLPTDDLGASDSVPWFVIDGTGNYLQDSADDSPGLQSQTPPLLVIDQPAFFVGFASTGDRSVREGGAVEVATAVASAQDEQQRERSAVIAANLDRGEVLPPRAPYQARPLVAELARSVELEVALQREVATTSEGDQAVRGRLENTPANLEPVPPTRPVDSVRHQTLHDRESTNPATGSLRSISTAQLGDGDEQSGRTSMLSDRLDDKRLGVHAATFAHWPMLATVVASYLLIERNGPIDSQAAQAAQRSRRHNRHTIDR